MGLSGFGRVLLSGGPRSHVALRSSRHSDWSGRTHHVCRGCCGASSVRRAYLRSHARAITKGMINMT
jgi:hypothetical protein